MGVMRRSMSILVKPYLGTNHFVPTFPFFTFVILFLSFFSFLLLPLLLHSFSISKVSCVG